VDAVHKFHAVKIDVTVQVSERFRSALGLERSADAGCVVGETFLKLFPGL
jgi:hypothetical protein